MFVIGLDLRGVQLRELASDGCASALFVGKYASSYSGEPFFEHVLELPQLLTFDNRVLSILPKLLQLIM